MMLGNDKAGDSIYIKAGDTDILIDAGSRKGSSQITLPYMNQYVKDNKLEYVIMTHGDQDHIEAFPNILNTYSADTIIYNQYTTKTTNAYKNTLVAFNKQKNNGANIYYASDCWNNTNGASREYKLSTKVTMSILYNEYYFKTQSDENNYSVCTLFTYDSGTENTISCLLVTLNVKVKKQWLPIMMVRQRKKHYLKLIYLKQVIMDQKLLQMNAYFL